MPLSSQARAHSHDQIAGSHMSHYPTGSQVALFNWVVGHILHLGRKAAQRLGRRNVGKPKGQVLVYKNFLREDCKDLLFGTQRDIEHCIEGLHIFEYEYKHLLTPFLDQMLVNV